MVIVLCTLGKILRVLMSYIGVAFVNAVGGWLDIIAWGRALGKLFEYKLVLVHQVGAVFSARAIRNFGDVAVPEGLVLR